MIVYVLMCIKQYQKQWFPPQERCELSDFLTRHTKETNLTFSLNGGSWHWLPNAANFQTTVWESALQRMIGKMLER